MPETVSSRSGREAILNVEPVEGWTANERQILCTVLRLRPHAFASVRVLHGAPSRGFDSSVNASTRSI